MVGHILQNMTDQVATSRPTHSSDNPDENTQALGLEKSPNRVRGSSQNGGRSTSKTRKEGTKKTHSAANEKASNETDTESATTSMLEISMELFEHMNTNINNLAAQVKNIADRQNVYEAERQKQAAQAAMMAEKPNHNKRKFEYDDESDDGEISIAAENDSDDDIIDSINELLGGACDSNRDKMADASDSEQWLAQLTSDLVDEEILAPDIMPELAVTLNKITTKRASDEKLKAKLDAYPPPANITGMTTPKVNPEVWSKLKADTRSRDIRLQKAQLRVVRGLTPLAQLAERILKAKLSSSEINFSECLTLALNAFSLIVNGNSELSYRRREMIRPDLNASYRGLCSTTTPITEYLFGDDLAQVVKDINETNRVATRVSGQGPIKGNSRFAYKGKTPYKHAHPYANARSKNGGNFPSFHKKQGTCFDKKQHRRQ